MFTSKLIKESGKLVYLDDKSKLNYKLFLDKLPEGQEIEIFIGLATSNKSVAQLAKVYACIRELAKESGYTFEEMKTLVKEQSGLCYSTGKETEVLMPEDEGFNPDAIKEKLDIPEDLK